MTIPAVDMPASDPLNDWDELDLDGHVGPVDFDSAGGLARIRFRVSVELMPGTRASSSGNRAGLRIFTSVDGEVASLPCWQYSYKNQGALDPHNVTADCEEVVNLAPGTHSIAFAAQYMGHIQFDLFGGERVSEPGVEPPIWTVPSGRVEVEQLR